LHKPLTIKFLLFAVPRESPVQRSLPFAVDQTLDAHRQASQPYRYTDADIRAIACFVSALVSFDQCAVDLALIKQARGGLRPTKRKNCLAFRGQLEETCARCAANAKREEAHKKSLAACFEVPFADRLTSAASTSAAPIAPKPILIDFKKVQGEDRVKVFQPKIKATIKRLTSLIELFDQFSDCMDISKFHQLERFLDRLLNLQDHLSERARTISLDQWQCLDFNLRQFSKIPFTFLRRRYPDVLKEVVLVLVLWRRARTNTREQLRILTRWC
jgi:hypothetical protein